MVGGEVSKVLLISTPSSTHELTSFLIPAFDSNRGINGTETHTFTWIGCLSASPGLHQIPGQVETPLPPLGVSLKDDLEEGYLIAGVLDFLLLLSPPTSS